MCHINLHFNFMMNCQFLYCENSAHSNTFAIEQNLLSYIHIRAAPKEHIKISKTPHRVIA